MRREDLISVITALKEGRVPEIDPNDTMAFSIGGLYASPTITPDSLGKVLKALVSDDIPVLERAIKALDGGERAWLGFKIVTDPIKALDSVDTAVVNISGEGMGSATGISGIFLVLDSADDRDSAEIMCSQPYSNRDYFQMLDITRGPRMHGEQYAGVSWVAEPLFAEDRLILLGATPVAAELAAIGRRIGFSVVVVDNDADYVNGARFPEARRVVVDSYDNLPLWELGEHDYVCVLTRGHMYDPEALLWGVTRGAGYVGMMGAAQKNERVFDLCEQRGATREQLEATHTPIGLRFGAVTPAELAVSIAAELIQVRHDRIKAAREARKAARAGS